MGVWLATHAHIPTNERGGGMDKHMPQILFYFDLQEDPAASDC